MLCALLSCGYLDVQFIDRELDDFDVNAGDVVEALHETEEPIDANTFIYQIYRIALDNAISEVDAHADLLDGDDTVSIYTNCLDSHLYVKDKDGNPREMHNYDELTEFLRANYSNFEDNV